MTGEPSSQFYKILHRVADRLQSQHRAAFLAAVERSRNRVDERALLNALKRKDPDAVLQQLGVTRLGEDFREKFDVAVRKTVFAGGEATAEGMRAAGLEVVFEATNPNALIAARRDVATLVTRISEETRRAVRGVVGNMFTSGVPPAKAAPRLRSILGLTEPQAGYVSNFTAQLEELQGLGPDAARFNEVLYKATDRRLDAVSKARIRRAAQDREITEELVNEFTETYASSLRNRRALNVGRTESLRASHIGQHETWRQAVERGQLDPERTRRVAIVTPDDRLRETHAAVPGMNADGVRMDEPFDTPFGSMMHPPWETGCRCSVGLRFEGQAGVL